MPENSAKVMALISVQGRDQKGVVARFATFVAERGINIEDTEQRVLSGVFVMDMLVDIREITESLDQLITGLLHLGRELSMEVRVTLQQLRRPRRVVVLVSREPHCLQTILAVAANQELHGTIVSILGNHPTLEPLAKAAGVPFDWKASGPTAADKAQHLAWLAENLKSLEPDLIVLARYMQVLPAEIVQAYRWKIINIHPSLLPHFPGANPYRQAFESGVRVTGCTAHFVTEALDQGPIILQDVFHINIGQDTAADVRVRGLELEAQTLAKAVTFFLNEELVVVEDKVVFKPGINALLRTGHQNAPA